MSDAYIAYPGSGSGGGGGGVTSLNGETGAISLVGGTGISITPVGSTIVVASTTSGGTVTSVALSLPASLFTVTGSPVTTFGTLTGSFNVQSANSVFAGPSSGSSAVPTFRSLVVSDIPSG